MGPPPALERSHRLTCCCTGSPSGRLFVEFAPAGGFSTGVSDQMLRLKFERFGLVLAVTPDFVAGPEEADVEVVTGVDVVLSAVVDGDHDVVAGTTEDHVVVVTAGHGVVAAVADHGVFTVATVEV